VALACMPTAALQEAWYFTELFSPTKNVTRELGSSQGRKRCKAVAEAFQPVKNAGLWKRLRRRS
jgi:hypothetical protein